ncbi:MAG: T9SS type A sorting domain-containing protein [Flavobacteriales bacterium]|nr:T9SS type A sorting domain-containing protein [Flavobacteriales bacterium]
MKKRRVFTLFTAVVLSIALQAQNSINLSIEHYLQDAPLAFNQASQTHEARDFDVTRLQYYISEISIEDNGGNTYGFDSLWVLVNASHPTDIDLGSGSMDSIVSVTFHIGVDSAHNHLDPSSWPNDHPLAHKTPSMHWGWANGYRFVAIEGNCGDDLNQAYELHGLGDENYFSVTIPTKAGADNGVIDVPVYANYAEILRGLDISNGLISHGPIYEAQTSVENMHDYVFGPEVPASTVTSDTNDTSLAVGLVPDASSFVLFPNPSSSNRVHIAGNSLASYTVQIVDLRGSMLGAFAVPAGAAELDLPHLVAGSYYLTFKKTAGEGPDLVHHNFVKL